MASIIDWLEAHAVTVDLAKWVAVIVVAWFGGVFKFLRQFNQRPKLEVHGPAGFCYLEERKDDGTGRTSTLAVFVLNPAIENPSDRSFEIARFLFGFDCHHIFRRFRQQLFHVSFPNRPQKKFGAGTKILPVFFTNFPDDLNDTMTVSGRIEARSMAAAYVMFISNTWGSWTPRVSNDTVAVLLRAETVGEGALTRKVKLRVHRDPSVIRDFCPDLYDHITSSEMWNLERC